MPPTYPTVDECRDRLHRAGWSMGETAYGPLHATVWLVDGTNGENVIRATGRTQAEAWWQACQQAKALSMLAPAREG